MEFFDSAIKVFSVMFSSGETTVVSVLLFGAFIAGGFYLKYKRHGIDKAEMFSKIDASRFTQMSEQLKQADHDRQNAEQEADLLTIERDHYRSRVRDLVFMIKQLRWLYDQHKTEKCQVDWPLKPVEEIETWAMVSPLEIGYYNEERRHDSDGDNKGRRNTDKSVDKDD